MVYKPTQVAMTWHIIIKSKLFHQNILWSQTETHTFAIYHNIFAFIWKSYEISKKSISWWSSFKSDFQLNNYRHVIPSTIVFHFISFQYDPTSSNISPQISIIKIKGMEEKALVLVEEDFDCLNMMSRIRVWVHVNANIFRRHTTNWADNIQISNLI